MAAKILFLTQILPYPLVGGAKIRAYYMLRHLSQQFQVTLVSFIRDDDRPEHVDHLRQFCQAVYAVPMARSRFKDGGALFTSLFSDEPVSIIRDRQPAMHKLLATVTQENSFDLIHADQTSMAQYALFAQSLSPNRPRLILDQHNAMYLLVQRQANYEKSFWQRYLWQREANRFKHYEARLCRQFDHVLTVTQEDRTALLHLLAKGEEIRFTVLPICVDPAGTPPISRQKQGYHLIHLGTMFWPPNVEGVLWFAQDVLPLIQKQFPETHFTIAGKNPPPVIQQLAQSNRQIEVTGYVADPTSLLARSQLFIVPVRAGGGMRVKILDGWLWGIPVVSTTIGAEGILTRPGQNILLADTPEQFAQAVLSLLSRPEQAKALAENGRQWVEQHYNWQTTYKTLNPIYQQLINP